MAWDGPKWGPRVFFFLLIQTLTTFWAERIWILRTLFLLIFWIPNFWMSRSPDFQNLAPGQAWAGPSHLSHLNQKILICYCKHRCWSSRPAVACRRDESKCHQVCIFPYQNERRVGARTSKRPFNHTVRTPHRKLCLDHKQTHTSNPSLYAFCFWIVE